MPANQTFFVCPVHRVLLFCDRNSRTYDESSTSLSCCCNYYNNNGFRSSAVYHIGKAIKLISHLVMSPSLSYLVKSWIKEYEDWAEASHKNMYNYQIIGSLFNIIEPTLFETGVYLVNQVLNYQARLCPTMPFIVYTNHFRDFMNILHCLVGPDREKIQTFDPRMTPELTINSVETCKKFLKLEEELTRTYEMMESTLKVAYREEFSMYQVVDPEVVAPQINVQFYTINYHYGFGQIIENRLKKSSAFNLLHEFYFLAFCEANFHLRAIVYILTKESAVDFRAAIIAWGKKLGKALDDLKTLKKMLKKHNKLEPITTEIKTHLTFCYLMNFLQERFAVLLLFINLPYDMYMEILTVKARKDAITKIFAYRYEEIKCATNPNLNNFMIDVSTQRLTKSWNTFSEISKCNIIQMAIPLYAVHSSLKESLVNLKVNTNQVFYEQEEEAAKNTIDRVASTQMTMIFNVIKNLSTED